MMNNLIQEAQRDDWHGQIVARPQYSYEDNLKRGIALISKLKWHSLPSFYQQMEHFKVRSLQWRRETEKSLAQMVISDR